MKISAALKDAFHVYRSRPAATVRFLVTEACITLAAFTPLLFLTNRELTWLALLAVPFYFLLVFQARVNAAEAMRDALRGGSLFSMRLIDPAGYGRNLLYGLGRMGLLLLWAAPLTASLIIAKVHISGEMDGFTLMRMIKEFGGNDLMTGILYLALIFAATLILVALGCAFHCGDRHAYVRNHPKLLKGCRMKLISCWFCSLLAVLPMITAVVAVIIRYLPALKDLNAIVTKTMQLPSTKGTLIILAVGAVLTVPLLPLRALIPAAYVNGLEGEQAAE